VTPVPTTHRMLEAFGSYLFVSVRRPSALSPVVRLAEAVVADVDATCSRFRHDSDLSVANAAAGRWVDVDPLLVAAVDVARRAAEATDGLVNPLLGRTLVQLGYDRDFALLTPPVATVHPGDPTAADAPPHDAWRRIRTDPRGAIRVPAGTALDLGSTGKAWAADLIARAIEAEHGEPALVSVGGDVRIAAADREPWEIAVSERHGGAVQQQIRLTQGGLATSSTRVRRWSHDGTVRHHLVDPRTGRPAAEVWRTVTATGPTCVAANTAATAAVVLGADAPAWLADRGVAARLQPAHGRVVVTGTWPRQPNGRLAA
jgi:thiamine biosynthesis lipoprotein